MPMMVLKCITSLTLSRTLSYMYVDLKTYSAGLQHYLFFLEHRAASEFFLAYLARCLKLEESLEQWLSTSSSTVGFRFMTQFDSIKVPRQAWSKCTIISQA